MSRLNFAKKPYENLAPWKLLFLMLGFILIMGLLFTGVKVIPLWQDQALAHSEAKNQDQKIEELETKIKALEPKVQSASYRNFEHDVQVADGLLKKREMSWLDLFRDLETVKPYNTLFASIKPEFSDAGINLHLDGLALNHEELLDLERKIMASPRFSGLILKGDVRESASGPRFEFKFRMTYHPNEDAPLEEVGNTLGVYGGTAK